MKKCLALLLALGMLLSLAACSEGEIEKIEKETTANAQQETPAADEKTEEADEKPLKLWESIWNGDMSQYEAMVPAEVLEQQKSIYGAEYTQWMEDGKQSLKEAVEESLQENGKITLTVTARETLPEADVKRIGEAVKNMYELDETKVMAAHKLDVTATYEKEGVAEESAEMYVMQYGDRWYLISYMVYGEEANVDFFLG